MLACVFLFLKVRPIRKLSWKRKYKKNRQTEQIVDFFQKSWLKILHLMDFQRKFNKHVLIWRRLFICCLVFIGRNIALSYMPSNRQCLKDTVLHSVFNSDGVSFKNQNSWSFIIFFIIQDTFIRYCSLLIYFLYIICHLSLSVTCTKFHLHLCLFIQRDTLEFYEKKLKRKFDPTVRCH